VTYL